MSLGSGADVYDNYLADNKIEISTYKLKKYDFGVNYQRRLESSVLSTGVIFTYGKNDGFSTSFGEASVPAKYFKKLNYNMSWVKPVSSHHNIQYHLYIDAQYSPNLLLTSEKSTLGGLSSVRGFKEHIENADNTVFARNELTVVLPRGDSKVLQRLVGDVSIFGAFDIGSFSNYEEQGKRSGVMSGISCGVKNSNGVIDFSLTVARPIETASLYRHKNIIYFSVAIDV